MLKNFFWRIVICVAPVVAAAVVVGIAWNNYREGKETGLRFNLGVDLAGGTILVYEGDRGWWESLDDKGRESFSSDALKDALQKRIDPTGTKEITIRAVKTSALKSTPPRVEIILPMRSAKGGSEEIEEIKRRIGQVGKLEFRILADLRQDLTDLEDRNDIKAKAEEFKPGQERPGVPGILANRYEWIELSPEEVQSPSWLGKEGAKQMGYPDGMPSGLRQEGTVFAYHLVDPEKKNEARHFALTRKPKPQFLDAPTNKIPNPEFNEVTGEDLTGIRPDASTGRWVVNFSLKQTGSGGKAGGAERFYQLNKGNVGYLLGIILDNRLVSAPVLKAELRDGGIIQMGGDDDARQIKQKVDDLVLILRSGALPATLGERPVSELTMGPGLGLDTIKKGTIAVIIAFAAVVAFMILYYRFAGTVASTALFANLLLTVGFMVLVKATFTLPGLAGLVLMLGMAVDANVLIYERIREERERGAGLALAIRNGYDRAFPTIIDTHLTSMFTAVVLYVVGNDQLKGFGVSLFFGLAISLFTSLYMTRLLFDFWQAKGWLTKLSMMNAFALLRFLGWPNINFMRVRYYWFTATVAASILGVGLFALRSVEGTALNIDFTGGTAYSVEFKEPQAIEDVRTEIAKSSLPNVSVDAIYRGDTTGGRTKYFTFRTTEKDIEKVQTAVEETFRNSSMPLEFVNVKDMQIQPETDTATNADYVLTLTLDRKGVTPAEVDRVLEGWLKNQPASSSKPYEFHEPTRGEGEAEYGLYEKVVVPFKLPSGASVDDLQNWMKEKVQQPVSERKENFDSQLALQTQKTALIAIALSWVAISLYLWFRFGSWTFGLAAVLCLIHDLLFAIGLIAVCHWLAQVPVLSTILMIDDYKLDLPAVAALLTLVGYSVNDTIVVFDRIREVRGKSPELTPHMIDESINQTLSRTLLTAFTTWLVVIVLYIWGGEGVHLFAFVMVVGIVIGTYSSIYVASPLLLIFGEGKRAERVRAKVQPQEAGV